MRKLSTLLATLLMASLLATAAESSLPPGINQQEIDWAMGLESKVKAGYQPTQQEIDQYGNIAKRLQASQQAPAQQPVKTDTVSAVSQADLDWATELQRQVQTNGYEPTASENTRYADIFKRYQVNPPPAKQDEDRAWAMELQRKIETEEYLATDSEMARYTDIYNRYQENPPPAKQDEDLSWAFDLLTRSRNGYAPTASERKRYEAIVRLAPATQKDKAGKAKKPAAK